MRAVFSPPSPLRLARKAVEVERLFGFGDVRVEPPPDPEALLGALLQSGIDGLRRPQQRYLAGLVGWARAERPRSEFDKMMALLAKDLGKLLPSAVGDLLPWVIDSPSVFRAIHERAEQFDRKTRGLAFGKLFAERLPGRPQQYTTAILVETTRHRGLDLTNWRQRASVPSGSPLERMCLEGLLSSGMVTWLASQPVRVLSAFLREHRGQEPVVWLANTLLVPLHKAGATPGHLAPEADLTHVVGLFERNLPSRTSTARRGLAPEVEDILRWADVRARLERIFKQWKASDTYRPAYWRGWIRHIGDVREFPGMKAVAMRIGDHWFIEFGDSGNASYSYSDQRWRAAARRVRAAEKPWDLRNLDAGRSERGIHNPSPTPWDSGWWWKFDEWVQRLTGIRAERES